jgi:uncharacterized membrane protein (DUF373 family)
MGAGYPLKSPRGRGHNVVTDVLERVEDGIYVLVSILLVVAGAVLLFSAIYDFVRDIGHISATTILLNVLDKGLILFIIAELLHTVRVTIQERTLVAEPFLIVGLIAGIRRILILTAQTTQSPFNASSQGVELVLLILLVLVMTGAVILYRRFYTTREG